MGPAWRDAPLEARRIEASLAGERRLAEGALEPLGVLELSSSEPGLGGVSAALWLDDRLLIASDRGSLWSLRTIEGKNGELLGVEGGATRAAPREPGVAAADWNVDLESLARLEGEADEPRIVFAFERAHRLTHAETHAETSAPWSGEDPWRALPVNRGIEALTALEGGGLLALAEDVDPRRGGKGWLISPDRPPREIVYRPEQGFAPTAADRIGDRVFLLERSVGLFSGWRARLGWAPIQAVTSGAFEMRQLAAFGAGDVVDNFEGLAARRRDGAIELYMVSDDNFSPLQSTLLAKFRWRPPDQPSSAD